VQNGEAVNPVVLARSHREWPWGLVFFSDSTAHDVLPPTGGSEIAVGNRTEVVSHILHQIDGEATAEVWCGGEPDGLGCVYSAPIQFPSVTIYVTDAARESVLSVEVQPGPWQASFYVGDETHPLKVVLVLSTPNPDLLD
jgi:hypothetical protein